MNHYLVGTKEGMGSKFIKKPFTIFPDDDGAVLVGKNKLLDQPKVPSITCYRILKNMHLMEFFY